MSIKGNTSKLQALLEGVNNLPAADSTYIAKFGLCDNLVTVRPLTVEARHTFPGTFAGCYDLVNVSFTDGSEIGNDISFADCTKLSYASFYSVRDHLADTATGKTVTFSRKAVLTEFGTGTGGIDGEAWGNFTATKPNWTFKLV